MEHRSKARPIPSAITIIAIVEPAQIDQCVEAQARVVTQSNADIGVTTGLDDQRQLAKPFGQADQILPKHPLKIGLQEFDRRH